MNVGATHWRRLRLCRPRTARAKRAVSRGHDAARAREARGGRGSAGAHDGAEETAANPCASRRSKASTNRTASRSRRASASGGGAGSAWRIATEIAIVSVSASEIESRSASESTNVSETASATDRAETGTEIGTESETEIEIASVCAAREPTRRWRPRVACVPQQATKSATDIAHVARQRRGCAVTILGCCARCCCCRPSGHCARGARAQLQLRPHDRGEHAQSETRQQ
jgi:hypothetical protein